MIIVRKKNGFTLVEILITITIIGLIALIVIPTVNNINKKALEKSKQIFYSNIKSAALSYADEFAKHTGTADFPTLYVQSWPNVQFYNESTPQLSLLNLVFKKIPEWSIGHVDDNLRKQERKFEESRVAVYDFLMNNICDTFKCIIKIIDTFYCTKSS